MTASSTNRWDLLNPPQVGRWSPSRTVSVVIPYFEALAALRRTLIAVGSQTYPRSLTEVVVVDDGSSTPLKPSDVEDITAVAVANRDDEGFRLAAARNQGAARSSGEILVFLDGDMIPDPTWLEHHLRWHHLDKPVLVLGSRSHVDDGWLNEDLVEKAMLAGGLRSATSNHRVETPEWIEFHLTRTKNLTTTDDDLFRVVTGGNLSIGRGLFDSIGGFDETFTRWGGEDTEFGYRAWISGALFVPERGAHCWHQGLGTVPDPGERQSQETQSRKLANLIPHASFREPVFGRTWERPTVVAEIIGGDQASVTATANSLLAEDDVLVVIDDSDEDAAIVEDLGPDPRVAFSSDPSLIQPYAPYRATVPAGADLGGEQLSTLLHQARLGGEASSADGVTVVSTRHATTGLVEIPPTGLPVRTKRSPTPPSRLAKRLKRIRSPEDVLQLLRWLVAAVTRRITRQMRSYTPPRERRLVSSPWSRVVAIGVPDLPAKGPVDSDRIDLLITGSEEDVPSEFAETARIVLGGRPDADLLRRGPLEASDALAAIQGGVPGSDPLLALLVGISPANTEPGPRTLKAEELAARSEPLTEAATEAIRRAVLMEHLETMRLDQLRRAAGLVGTAPRVSVLLSSRRADRIGDAVESVLAQTYGDLELVLIGHGVAVPPPVRDRLAAAEVPYRVLEVSGESSFGAALSRGSREVSGDLLAKMDDDDLYSASHIEDLVVAWLLSRADIVGKGAEFVYMESQDSTLRRFQGGAYSQSPTIAGGAMAITREAYDRVGGWVDRPRHVDQALISDVLADGGTVFRTHGLGYVLVRHGDHTWSQSDRAFVDQGEQRWDGIPDWILSEQDPDQVG